MKVVEVIMTMFVLIGIFLFLNNWRGTVNIINAVGSKSDALVSTLQGR